ncbi:Hypothetical protein CINCED_3A019971 [Cinara cedri]|uniref:Uncharacterized protein n=1 Tax=Cinara cedri TaxID=506608 RepID=A0A5E4N403_9HEMI|nr:Hypothetical protein CINCED_3A019971 [Cinara cedri]
MKDTYNHCERSKEITSTFDSSQDTNLLPSTEDSREQSDLEDECQLFRSLIKRNILKLGSVEEKCAIFTWLRNFDLENDEAKKCRIIKLILISLRNTEAIRNGGSKTKTDRTAVPETETDISETREQNPEPCGVSTSTDSSIANAKRLPQDEEDSIEDHCCVDTIPIESDRNISHEVVVPYTDKCRGQISEPCNEPANSDSSGNPEERLNDVKDHFDLWSDVVPGISPWSVADFCQLTGSQPQRLWTARRSANGLINDGLPLAYYTRHRPSGRLANNRCYYARLSAGNDDHNRICRVPTRVAGRQPGVVDGRRGPAIWDNQQRLPPLRAAFRNQNPAADERQQHQRRPSRIPIATHRQASEPRRVDNPVQLYEGSRIPVMNRAGAAPARVSRPRPPTVHGRVHARQEQPNVRASQEQPNVQAIQEQPHVQERQEQPRALSPSNDPPRDRHGSYNDMPSANVGQQCPRRNTINVNAAGPCQRHNIYNAPDQNAAHPRDAARRASFDAPANQMNPRGPYGAARRATYDTPGGQMNPRGPYDAARRAPFDEPVAQLDPDNVRRALFDAQANQMNAGRRATPDAVPNQPNPGSLRRDTYDVPDPMTRQRNMTYAAGTSHVGVNRGGSTFTVSGTISVNTSGNGVMPMFFAEDESAHMHSPQQSPQRMADPDTSDDVVAEDFLDNFERFNNVLAPRAIALPGSPYVHVDANAPRGNTPEGWINNDMSSIGSEPRSMDITPARYGFYQDGNGMDDDSWSMDQDRENVPFGLDDSYEMPQANHAQPAIRRSRGVSLDRDRGPCGRRRDTFDRRTH